MPHGASYQEWTATELAAPVSGLGEGPHWSVFDEALWWVDIAWKKIHRLTPATGELRSWITPKRPTALIEDEAGGKLAVLEDGLYRFDMTGSGSFSPLCPIEANDPETRCNEARVGPDGCLWLGTMQTNFTPDGGRAVTQSLGTLYSIGSDFHPRPHLHDIGISNTLVWTSDGKRLGFADTIRGRIDWYGFGDHATGLGEAQPFIAADTVPGGPDGSAIDAEDNVWNARWGAKRIQHFDTEGNALDHISVAATNVSSCAFGGPDFRTLYITTASIELDQSTDADGKLFAVELPIGGRAPYLFKL